ncbi:MAG: uracil-DNA glycosylase family protein [Verrucomicrobia bacterium]|nr:MAG: uracil-DNA glycosylase family protein [Verrucomicrobiota bacterium]
MEPDPTRSGPTALDRLRRDIAACTVCAAHLPHAPRPVVRFDPTARLLIAGQAPGRRVHETGIPFDDPSGDRLRDWLGIGRDTFYDETQVALVPMGFCYPGTGESGDLPPRKECAATWRKPVLGHLGGVVLTLAVGRYAIDWHLGSRAKATLAETVRSWRGHPPGFWPLPHPSPRNNLWLRRNPWFEREVLPELRRRVAFVLSRSA